MTTRALRRLGLLLLCGATLAGIAYGLHWLEPYAHAAVGDGSWRLEWVKLPSDDWIREEIERDALTRDLLRTDLRAPDLCERIGRALGRSAWIASVERVSKQPNGIVKVNAVFREYVTFILQDRFGYLVDQSGVRLNRTEHAARLDAEQVALHMIYLEGVREGPPQIGQPWPGPDVQAGLKLVRFLQESPNCPAGLRASLVAVDVANFGDRLNRREGWLRIRTVRPDLTIRWGLPPGEENGIECSAADKLARLWVLYATSGQLPDRPWIDLRDLQTVDLPQVPHVP